MCYKMPDSTRQGDEVCSGIMILPSSHSPCVQSVAGNEGGCMRTMQGCNSRGADKLSAT